MNSLYNNEYVKMKLKDNFNIEISTVKLIGSGYDSEAYLINNEFIFKFAKHKLACKDYIREKRILDFLKGNLKTNIKIPVIEYFSNASDIAIMGYKVINGTFLSPTVYKKMNDIQKRKLIQAISDFLKKLHSLNVEEIAQYTTDNRDGCIDDLELLKAKVYSKLDKKEIDFIEDIFNRILNNKKIFNGNKCLCHNDFSCNHILLNDNYELVGIIDFGDACITDEYCDFLYLLEESDEEIGRDFGIEILKSYDLKNIETALEYADLKEEYYPIETILCGIKNNSKELFDKGLELLEEKANE